MLIFPNSNKSVKSPRRPSVKSEPMPNETLPAINSLGLRNEITSVPKITKIITKARLKLSFLTESMTSDKMNCDEKVRRSSPSKFQWP